MNIVFLSYREWAQPVLEHVRQHPRVQKVTHFDTNDSYWTHMHHAIGSGKDKPDLVMYCGWSDEPVERYLDSVLHVGLHCAADDVYSGGTPLQNQINDGLTLTKHRVFKVGYPELSLREWSHEVDLSLAGGMSDILAQMTSTSITLYEMFLNDWPSIDWKKWPPAPQRTWRKKRTPEDSRLTHDDVKQMTTRELYNFFRGLESPYPNGYIEDDEGRLYINSVRFKER